MQQEVTAILIFTYNNAKNLKVISRVQVAFVAIGATMVGSITFTKREGDYVKKGDEVCDIIF